MLLGIALHAALSFALLPWIVQDSQQSGLFDLFFLAVHGFRMPLFFMVSGFFTAMLWRRRGLKSLLWHRTRRILLPCLLGLVTIVPLLELISRKAIESRFGASTDETASDSDREDLVASVRGGDLDSVRQLLEQGSDGNTADSQFGVTPLAWAALHGNLAVAELLLNSGADVNARNQDGTTALHSAVFLGRPSMAALLIERGADVNARNQRGETPSDVLDVNLQITRGLAAWLRIPLGSDDELSQGRDECRRMLPGPTTRTSNGQHADSRPGERLERMRAKYGEWLVAEQFTLPGRDWRDGQPLHLFLTPVFHHLWFLWFLCWLVPLFAIYASIADATRWQGVPAWLVVSPIRYVWLLPLTMLPQSLMGSLSPTFGPDTSVGVLPQPHLLVYYGIFFGFGALYFDAGDERGQLGRWWWLALPIAILVALPVGLVSLMSGERHFVSAVAQVIYSWTMVFGLVGLFRVLLRREIPWVRYLSDSSYWLYLAHVPLIIAGQAWIREWHLPAIIKFSLLCGVVTVALLVVYELLVRYSWLGRLLNGPRQRPRRGQPGHAVGTVGEP